MTGRARRDRPSGSSAPLGGVAGLFGLHGPQQPHLGGDLGGQVGERDGGVTGVELERRLRGSDPLAGPRRPLVVVRRLGDHCREPLGARLDQQVRVGPPFQHREVSHAEVTAQRRHRQQLADQVLDPHLVLGRCPGQAIRRPHPPIQRGAFHPGQLQWLQAGRVQQRQPGQGVGVDAVGLGVPGQEPAQVRRLGRRHPMHHVAPVGEEHRDRQPRRARRLHHHLQTNAPRAARQRSCLHCGEALHGRPRLALRDRLAGLVEHPHRVRAGDTQVDADQAPTTHLVSPCRVGSTGSPAGATPTTGHGPKEDTPNRGSHSCAATGSGLNEPSHFPHPGHPWPGRVGQSGVRGQTPNRDLPQSASRRHPPDQPGRPCNPRDPAPWWIHGADVPLHERSPVGTRTGTAPGPARSPRGSGAGPEPRPITPGRRPDGRGG